MIGQTILHYKILEKLGEGGMGVVFKAYDLKLERDVAIKLLSSHLVSIEDDRNRFLREAKSASALNHPNVCTVHAFEELFNRDTKLTEHFIVMEYITGSTLREKNKEGPLKITDAILYALQVAEALKEAHAKGIAHLDIKSDNIMINANNQVKVMDFGLAKIRDSKAESGTEGTYGTLAYMSPEQALGKSAGFASDIWSFGIVLYEMLTGKLPFMDSYDAAMIYSIINDLPIPPSTIRVDINHTLEKIILTCLDKNEEKRYQDIELIIKELKKQKEESDTIKTKESFEQIWHNDKKKETEQKQATIVFMKIPEYPELIENIGQESVVGILEKCYTIVTEITKKYGGTVKKIDTGNIVLYFGLPTAIENSAPKALLASLEISDSIIDLRKKNQLPITLTINAGINTGIVIAGSISSGSSLEYTVIGDAVETASKISELSNAAQILVGQGTYRYTNNLFEFEQIQSFTLRGKRDPIKVYKLRSAKVKATKNIIDSGRLIYSEMVGRIKELDKLEFLLHKAINGEGSIVNIIAEAGIGKSRLLNEFRKKEIIQRVNIFEGKALSTGKNISFHPIIDILKQWARINDNDNESQGLSKLENSIQRIFKEEANEVIPFIATLMGFSLSGEYEKRIEEVSGDSLNNLIQKSIRDLILKGSEIKPIVFIIEDLHWADSSSMELLISLFRLAENNKILFVNTLRPNLMEPGEHFTSVIKGKYSRFHTEIKLDPLNYYDCQILLQNLLKTEELPIKLKNYISRCTEGNPFFIEEVVRSMIDDDIIEIKNNRFIISKTIEEIVIPGTIKDILLSRIDKLDESTKNLLKIASVIGRHFLNDILLRVAKEIDDIDLRILYLEKLELIEKNDESNEHEYLFKHALVQESVYETMLTKNRKELHLKVAYVIEELYSERIHEFYEMLAHHYSLGNDKEKAEEYLIKAGERTLKTAASFEALNYFKEALKLYIQKYGDAADREKIFIMEKNIGLSFYNRGYFKEAVEHFSISLNTTGIKTKRSNFNETIRFISNIIKILIHLYFPSKGKRPPSEKDYMLFDILFKMVIAYANINGKKMFLELLNLVRLKMDFKLNGEDGFNTYSIAGSLFCFSGISFSLGRKFIDRANRHAHLNGIEKIYNNGYDETLCDYLSGNWKNFTGINEKLLDAKIRTGDLVYVIYQICWALYITIYRGDYEYAEYLIHKGDNICEVYDFEYGKLYILSFKADINLARRNLHKAINYYNESIELAGKLNLSTWIIGLAGKKAKAFLLLNDTKSAKESIDTAEKAIGETEDSLAPLFLGYIEAYKLLYLIRIYETAAKEAFLIPGGTNKLEKEIEKSIKIAGKLACKVAEIKPETDRFIGIYYSIKNKHKTAFKYFLRSIEHATNLGALPELGRTYLETAKYLLKCSIEFRNKNRINFLSEAEQIFNKLNLKWDLDELDRIRKF